MPPLKALYSMAVIFSECPLPSGSTFSFAAAMVWGIVLHAQGQVLFSRFYGPDAVSTQLSVRDLVVAAVCPTPLSFPCHIFSFLNPFYYLRFYPVSLC